MSEVVSFTDYRPPERFDGNPWTQAQIDEAASSAGPWSTIDTVTFDTPDPDPASPQDRSFTTGNGTAPGLWYRVAFLDGSGGVSTPTAPIQNTTSPRAGDRRDLCTLADIAERTPGYEIGDDDATDDALADFITKESRDFMEVTRREFTSIGENPSTRTFDVDWIVVEDRELLIGDAAAITGVVLKGQDGTVLQTLDESGWVLLPRVREDWEPVTSLYFPPLVTSPAFFSWPAVQFGPYVPIESPRLYCEVTGTWGFPAIPDTVKRAVAVIVLLRYLNDAASVGTKLADAADRAELNLAGSLRAAFDTRDRFRVPSIGTSSIRS
jgi:hypothetical protein